jgi:hypothetical protein
VVDGEGGDQAGKEGLSELGNGVAAPVVAGEGAIDPYEQSFDLALVRSPPMFSKDVTWREERDGVDAPKESSEGAIDPFERSYGRVWGRSPPILMKGAKWGEECAVGAAAEGIVLPRRW